MKHEAVWSGIVVVFLAASFAGCGERAAEQGKLVVTSISPEHDTADPRPLIRVRFASPVVETEAVGKPMTGPPVAIEPRIDFTAAWEDRATLLVQPKERLKAGTRYTVRLIGPLAQAEGKVEHTFAFRPLKVEDLVAGDLAMLPTRPGLSLRFNQKVEASTVEKGCSLVDGSTGKPVELKRPEISKDGREALLAPASELEKDHPYELRCSGVKAESGNDLLETPFKAKLRTHPILRLVEARPTGTDIWADGAILRLKFSTPVEEEKIRKAVSITPAEKRVSQGWLEDSVTYKVELELKPHTEYEVRVKDDLVDVFGQRLDRPVSLRFTTGDMRPWLGMETGARTLEAGARGYPVWTRNIQGFDVDCSAVPEDELVRLLAKGIDFTPSYESGENKDLRFKELGLKHQKTGIKVQSKKNVWTRTDVDLRQICRGDGSGVYLAEVTSREMIPNQDAMWRFHPRQRALVNVTDLGVLLKAGAASGLAWVTSLVSGGPVAQAHVAVYDLRGRKVFEGQTDANGLLALPGTSELIQRTQAEPGLEDEETGWVSRRLVAVIDKDGDRAVVDGEWSDGIELWSFHTAPDFSEARTRIRGFIQSDRGIYRPGETVHFKGLVRETAVDRLPAVPQGEKVAVKIEDSRGTLLFDRTLDLSGFGGFSFDLALSEEVFLGDYFVTASVKKQTFRETFLVEEFRKLSFDTDLKPSRSSLAVGDEIGLEISAHYLFGPPVKDAEVAWSVMRRPHRVACEALPEHTFNDDAAASGMEEWWEWGWRAPEEFVTEGTGKTDPTGLYRLVMKDPKTDLVGPYDYLVQATVKDSSGEAVSKRRAVSLDSSDFYVGLRVGEYVVTVGKPFRIATAAIAPDQKRVDASATLSLVRQEHVCSWNEETQSDTCSTKQEKVLSREILIPKDREGVEEVTVAEPGEYAVRLDAKDKEGRAIAASTLVWAAGKGEAAWSGNEEARMQVVPSKREFRPGETARFAPQTSLRNPTALVTVEREGVVEAKVMQGLSQGEGIEVPVTEAYAPNVFVSIAMVQGRTGDGDRNRPRFQMGLAELRVSTEERRLSVDVKTDKAVYEPGDRVSGVIRVTSDGKPLESEVSVSVADEGVLKLIAYETPDPMKAFYAPFGSSVESAMSLLRLALEKNPYELSPEEGADSGGPGASKVRSRFLASAFWAPALVTDRNGEARFSFSAPDNLTTFRIMAVAADQGSRFGSGQGSLLVTKKLLARPLVPRFLSTADQVEVGVEVHNLTDRDGDAEVSLEADGVKLGKNRVAIRVKAQGTESVLFPAEVMLASKASFTFSVRMGNLSDVVKVEVPVSAPLVIDTLSLRKGRMEKEARVQVDWPKGAEPDQSRLEIDVDRTGLAELGPALRYLVEYPYGCLEQTLSRFIPLVKVKDLAKTLEIKDLEGDKLEAFIRAGSAKVLRYQQADGHFTLWPDGATYPHLTVYALYGLHEARRSGVAVDEEAMERAAVAVRSWADSADRNLGDLSEAGTLAQAAYVLASLGKPDPALQSRLDEQRRMLPLYGQAFLLAALKLNAAPSEEIRAVEDELLAAIERTDGSARVKEEKADAYYHMGSSVRSSAILLSALLLADPENPAVDELAEGLRMAELPSGYWMSTQENAYALTALADYARSRTQGPFHATVLFNGKPLADQEMRQSGALLVRKTQRELSSGELVVRTSDPARCSVRLTVARRDPELGPVSRGIEVSREFLDADSGKKVQGAVPLGKLVRVRVIVKTGEDRHFVALVDPLPAGLEPVNTRLDTSVREERGEEEYDGESNPDWTYIEMRDDRVQAFADFLPTGELQLEYLARAMTPGRFVAPPSHAEAMYQPEKNGRSGYAKMEVKP